MILGKNLIVSIDDTPIYASKSCQINIAQEFLQACSPTDGRTLRKIPTIYEWSISANGLVAAGPTGAMLYQLIVGQRVLLSFSDGQAQTRAGFAYIKSVDQAGSVGSLATYQVTFESDGPLYIYYKYTTAPFNAGRENQMYISNNALAYTFGERHYNVLSAGSIVEGNSFKIKIKNSNGNVWAIYQGMKNAIETAIGSQDQTTLDSCLKHFGDSDSDWISLEAGTYTILSCRGYQSSDVVTAYTLIDA